MNTKQTGNTKIRVKNLTFSYKGRRILDGINENFEEFAVTAIIGPSGVGKSTFLMTLNRLWENIPEAHMSGKIEIRFNGELRDIYERSFSPPRLRKLVGTVFQKPNPLPMSIFRNVAFPLKLSGEKDKGLIAQKVEGALRKAYLWDEVKDRLVQSALALSGGQQQRLGLARVLAMEPEVILLDEPCSGLDPISTGRIEEALVTLKARYSVVLVTNNTKQAARASDRTAFFLMGEMVEVGPTTQLFTNPADRRTSQYITGHFG